MKNPLVSIIITTKNEETVIERLLTSIVKQSYRKVETIVVDNFSTDKTANVVKKSGFVKFYKKGPERSVQRNFGAKKAKGKYLLFLDADMELSKDVVFECVEKARDKKIASLIIPEISVAKTFWEKVKAYERSFYNEKGDRNTDAARFFDKVVFNKVGGYDETITGPEDWDLPETINKSGYKTGRVKSPIFHYERIKSPFVIARKKFYYGLKSHRYFKKQDIPLISAKTVYFLRPVFYKSWKKLIKNPMLTLGLFIMLFFELLFGASGYLIGKIKNA